MNHYKKTKMIIKKKHDTMISMNRFYLEGEFCKVTRPFSQQKMLNCNIKINTEIITNLMNIWELQQFTYSCISLRLSCNVQRKRQAAAKRPSSPPQRQKKKASSLLFWSTGFCCRLDIEKSILIELSLFK